MTRIDSLLEAMTRLSASDLHLTSGFEPRYRIHGEITVAPGSEKIQADELLEMLRGTMPPGVEEGFLAEGDADYAYEIPGVGRYRANLFRDRFGPGAVFRTIPTQIPSADDLGLPAAIRRFSTLSKGLVLVTGPTGSGKSTTLAAIIDEINRTRDEHIITIEDPIEFVHPPKRCLVNQREVHRDTESFARALRAALREDPDIVLVGEMRDLETIEIALETAETGHLVFGTLHTNSAAATIDRIVDKFPSDRQNQIRSLLGDTLKGVVAQTLCRKTTGGRVAAFEILVVNTPVAAHIREGKTFLIPSVMQTSRNIGMQTFADDLVRLATSGAITPDEAYLKAADKESMRTAMQNAGLPVEAFGEQPSGESGANAPRTDEIAPLRKKLEANPNDAKTMMALSLALSTAPADGGRDGREALRLAEAAARIGTESAASTLLALGSAKEALGDDKTAMAYFTRALAEAKRGGDNALLGPLHHRIHLLTRRAGA